MGTNLRPLYVSVNDAATRVEGFVKQTRAKAMATTSAYRIKIQANKLVTERAVRCTSASWTADPKLKLALPEGITLQSTPNNPLCFDSRGYAQTPLRYTLTDQKGHTRELEVLLGGAVRRR